MDLKIIQNIHKEMKKGPGGKEIHNVRGEYDYYHYGCDGKDDRGWGCGYRTLQSLCSWVRYQQGPSNSPKVPSLQEVQKALVKMGDKDESFIDSREWIGSFEVCLCLDYFYDVPCKILHIRQGSDLRTHLEEIKSHFVKFGAPVMMEPRIVITMKRKAFGNIVGRGENAGGDTDNSSKGILGVCMEPAALLVMDPHYYGKLVESVKTLETEGWIKWVPIQDFRETSFYNLCLPQLIAKDVG